jgi:hypothetical protein
MTSLTVTADEEDIAAARERAEAQASATLNDEMRAWLRSYVGRHRAGKALSAIRDSREMVNAPERKFTRDEMNERGSTRTSSDARVRGGLSRQEREALAARARATLERIGAHASTGGRTFTREERNER